MKCGWRRCNNEVVGGRKTKFCSRLCGIKQHTIEKRRRQKERAVKAFGRKCSKCGYDRCLRALHFHHTDPRMKKFHLSGSASKAWKVIEAELKKCVLLCANCHAEEEDAWPQVPTFQQ